MFVYSNAQAMPVVVLVVVVVAACATHAHTLKNNKESHTNTKMRFI